MYESPCHRHSLKAFHTMLPAKNTGKAVLLHKQYSAIRACLA